MKPAPALIAIALPFALMMPVGAQSISNGEGNTHAVLVQIDDRSDESTTSSVEILSDTEGVDFAPFFKEWHRITEATWQKLIPPEVNRPTLRRGTVVIRFKILPDGKIQNHSMVLVGRSGFTKLDQAAWYALTGSKYPSLPSEFQGEYLEMQALFLYNTQPAKKPPAS